MTALEFMDKMLRKHERDLKQQLERGANDAELNNIRLKIGYYEEVIGALRLVRHSGKESKA